MPFSMIPLLMHNPDLSADVRGLLAAAHAAEPELRDQHLVSAARLLAREVALDCADARELVGLPPGGC